MAKKKKSEERSKASSEEASKLIKKQIEAFLSSGGEIEMITRGVSGKKDHKGQKHLVLHKENSGKR